MNLDQMDQLRASLQRESQHIEPVGLGAETVQRRGRKRRHLGRAVVAVGAATCVAGLGVAVTQRGSAPHSVAVASSSSGAATPTLAFRTVNGTVSFTQTHVTSAAGVTYSLSTAPGVAANPADPGQAIYRTSDGEHFDTAAQSATWISDLAERDGVLYAVGTAPGATDINQVNYRIGTSHDNGAAWTDASLPFDSTAPDATVPVSRSSAVQVASGPSATVALLTEQFYPDLDALVSERAPGKEGASTEQTADGFAIVDYAACKLTKDTVVAAAPTARGKIVGCDEPPVLGTITWADLGLSGPGDLVRQQILVSTDGTHWDAAAGPSAGYVRDLVASSNGFLLLDEHYSQNGRDAGRADTTVYQSSDARTWTAVNAPAGMSVQGVAGDRIIGTDSSGTVQTSADGGATWNATDVGSKLPAGTPRSSVWLADAGPLGFAAIATADGNTEDADPGQDFLLFSTDGVTWKTSDLDASGAPANAAPFQVTVGADHVSVDFQSAGPTPNGPMKTTTLLATPTR